MTHQIKTSKPHETVNLDRILIEEVGSYGRFQLRTLILFILIAGISGLQINLYIFTFTKVNTRCLIPECERNASQANFTPSWIDDAIPKDGNSYDKCHHFATISNSGSDSCSPDLFNHNSTVACSKYVYEHANSAVVEFNLACDDWLPNLVGSVMSFGYSLAFLIGGFVADHWGRRFAMALSSFNMAWIGAMNYFASTYISYTLIGFASTLLGASYYTNAFILAVEFVRPKHRVVVAALLGSFNVLGRVLMGMIAGTQPYWRNLILIAYCPALITFVYFWIAPESIRWLLSKNHNEKALNALKSAAHINGNSLSEKTLQSFRDLETIQTNEDEIDKTRAVFLIWKYKPVLLRCLVTPVWWFTVSFVNYGLSISAVNISGSPYINYSVVSAASIPGYWIAVSLLDRTGRKPLLLVAFWLCGVSQLLYIFIDKDNYWLSLPVYLMGKLCISICHTAISVYTAELYPTQYRAILFALSNMLGRIGSILAPLAPTLAAVVWEHLPFAAFGFMAFLSGLLVPLTPETLGTTLPQTMAEAADLGKGQELQDSIIIRSLKRLVSRNQCYTVQ